MKTKILILFSLFISQQIIAQDLDCSPYHLGYFQYVGKFENTIIYRTETHQIEYYLLENKWVVLKLDWKDDCNYKITYAYTNRKEFKPYLGFHLTVKIVEGNEEGYDYEAINSAERKTYHGQIVLMKRKLTDKDKQKIEARLAKCLKKD